MTADDQVIDLEAHFVTDAVVQAWQSVEPRWQDAALQSSTRPDTLRRLREVGTERLAAMDEAGVDVQVLSLSTPGVQNLEPELGVTLQTDVNDRLAEFVRARPDRFQAFATLATARPEQASAELERAVTHLGLDGAMLFGRTREHNMDDVRFWPIYEAAQALNAPLYLHPQSPPRSVRTAYYSGFGTLLDAGFATYGMGWDYETGVQLVRMMLAGVFDRFPGLRLICSHWGEMVLFYLERIDQLASITTLARPPSEYLLTQCFVTPGGMLNKQYLRWATEVLGPDRIMFASDYPFVQLTDQAARRFAGESVNTAQADGIAARTWQRLRAEIRR